MRAGRAAQLRAWVLVMAALVAFAGGQSHDHGHEGHDGHDGHPGPFGQHGHENPSGGEGEGFHGRAPVCTPEQTKDAVDASSNYVECAGLEYADFMSLVHADMQILQDAAACFKEKAEEIEPDAAGKDQTEEEAKEEVKEMEAKLDKAFDECVEAAKKTDDTNATQATTDFLEKMLGPDSKICACFPAFVDKMPECESWSRFHHFGLRLEDLCKHVSAVPMFPGPVEVQEEEEVEPAEVETPEVELPEGEAKAEEPAKAETASAAVEGNGEEHPPHLPHTWGPCPPGQEVHPDDPKDCQPSVASEEELDARESSEYRDDSGAGKSGGGLFGLGMSFLGVVAVGGVVGFGGVWAWGKFSSATRQPGVRYMATDLGDDNLGTELGPFGREYA